MIKAALLGAGSRGMYAYASYALHKPNEIQFVAVAEPDDEKREKFAKLHSIPPHMQFSTWHELLDQPKLCEALLICTQDQQHYEPTMKALQTGYHILLEKPMSPIPLEALEMAEEAERLNRMLSVCHVCRYSTYYSTVKKLLEQKAIGNIMSIQWTENVGYWHQAHSFVRGNWGNSQKSSPMLLQKCCHDMDLLQWFIGGECESVSSYGKLSYFTEANAPEGSTARCTDGCKVEHECLYSAIKVYYNEIDEWPQNVVTLEPKLDLRWKALQEGPYGRCVYRCDNDVVDHQVVNMLFNNEVTVAFTMSAFTAGESSRTFKIMGTTGELRGHVDHNEIEMNHFSGKREVIHPELVEGFHGGADTLIMKDFIQRVQKNDIHGGITSGMESTKSHLIVFAAEQSRVTGKTVEMNDFISSLRNKSISASSREK
jgi:predicted dehydrogenase